MLYSIGHSNKPLENLIQKLVENKIDVLVDVRSRPGSRWNPQFNVKPIQGACDRAGIEYVLMGHKLGGLDGNIDWNGGIDYLVEHGENKNLCVMCSEQGPEKCHRSTTIEPALKEKGVELHHILWNNKSVKQESLSLNLF